MRISDWSSDVCSSDLRLWEAAATSGMPPYDPPEILERDLSTLLLDCAQWGVADPAQLKWIDPPPAAAVQEARVRLQSLEALDDDDRITAHVKAISRSEEHTSELQSLMRISYAVFCLKKKNTIQLS